MADSDAGYGLGEERAAMARALASWRADPLAAPVLAAMQRFAGGELIEQCAALAALFSGKGSAARTFVDSFVAAMLSCLDVHPLVQVPLAHGVRSAVPTLVLSREGTGTHLASLALAVYDGAALARMPAPKTVEFAPVETWFCVISGKGEADVILRRDGEVARKLGDRGDRALLQAGSVTLTPGTMLYRHGLREALQVRRVEGNLVVLRLQRRIDDPEPLREYSLPDGTLLHQAFASEWDSRRELAMTLLGRMGRRDAVPDMARIASGADGKALRWEALRQILALDPASGLALVNAIATDGDDCLAGDAAHLQQVLMETWPDLERIAPWQS